MQSMVGFECKRLHLSLIGKKIVLVSFDYEYLCKIKQKDENSKDDVFFNN